MILTITCFLLLSQNDHVDAATIPPAAQGGTVEPSQLVQNREKMRNFGTQTSLEDQLATQPARLVSNKQLRDGNLIITWSDSDESRTVTDHPADPTPVMMPKLKPAMIIQGSSSALEPESPPIVQRMLFAEITDPESENAMVEILEDDDEVVEILRPTQPSARKKRAKKLREPLPKEFLRRSKRQAQKSGGFKGKSAVEILNPKPLAMIPASPTQAPAPHLNKAIVEGIASGFLQIHPRDVSDALIKMDANEENK